MKEKPNTVAHTQSEMALELLYGSCFDPELLLFKDKI